MPFDGTTYLGKRELPRKPGTLEMVALGVFTTAFAVMVVRGMNNRKASRVPRRPPLIKQIWVTRDILKWVGVRRSFTDTKISKNNLQQIFNVDTPGYAA
jgi:hypothetical protein